MVKQLSLQYFIQRSAALVQYRKFLKVLRPLPVSVREDLHVQIRERFEACRGTEDIQEIRMNLGRGEEELKQLQLEMTTTVAVEKKEIVKWPWQK